MFLTMLDHEGHTWKVELQALPGDEDRGLLEFAFSRRPAGEAPERLAWRVSDESLDALSGGGTEVSEDLLRRQLVLAIEVAGRGRAVRAG
jgi:hypothetical protein